MFWGVCPVESMLGVWPVESMLGVWPVESMLGVCPVESMFWGVNPPAILLYSCKNNLILLFITAFLILHAIVVFSAHFPDSVSV